MRIAGMNITFRYYPFSTFLDCMETCEIQEIELWAGEPHLYVYRELDKSLKKLKQELRSREMKIICYTPEQCVYPYNIANSNADWRKNSIQYFIDNLYAASELNADKLLITSGIGDFSVPLEESWKYASDSIYQISRVAEKEGITLALEPLTRFESNLIIDLQGIKKMIQEVQSPVVKGMVDTVAMQLAGETPEDYYSQLNEISHFHLLDGDGKTDAHLALGDGILPWMEYLESLHKHHYEGVCTLEIMGSTYYQNPQQAIMNSIMKIRELQFTK